MKFWVTIILSILSLSATAQSKFFKDALEKGRQRSKYYKLVNNGTKMLDSSKLKEYCQKNDYLWGSYDTKSIARFGSEDYTVSWFEFLPKSEYSAYFVENVNRSITTPVDITTLTNKGTAFLFVEENYQQLKRFDNMKWSGQIVNGRVHGQGTGFYAKEDGTYAIIFNGTFDNGLPITKIEVRIYSMETPYSVFDMSKAVLSPELQVGKQLNDGMLTYKRGDRYGFIDMDGSFVTSNEFDEIISDFSNGRATVHRNDTSEIYINKLGKVVGVSPKAQKEIDDRNRAFEEARRKAEEERLEAERKKAEEQALAKERALEIEKRRKEAIRNAQVGDVISYSDEWKHTETWKESFLIFFSTTKSEVHNISVRVLCFVEENVNNGERLKVRVNRAVHRDNGDKTYKTIIIDGIEYEKGDIIWIKPLNDNRWWIEN